MMRRMSAVIALVATALCSGAPEARAGATLDAVKARGTLNCGIHTGVAGFARPDSRGVWQGFDVDFCRGLATALFNDPDKVRFTPLSTPMRFTALSSGEVDVLFRTSTATMLRDTSLGIRVVTPNFYDGHGFMVRADAKIAKATDMGGATVCLLQGSTNELITAEFFRANNMALTPVLFERADQAAEAFQTGRCDAYGTDASLLAAARSSMRNPSDWTILPERFSKEPYGPYVRRGDDEWYDVVRWYVNAVIQAEESGVTQANVDEVRRTTTNPDTRRLLGVTPELGQAIKLDPLWVVNVVKAVGSYGEIYDRHMGPASPVGLPRGANELWTRGGLLYALPMR